MANPDYIPSYGEGYNDGYADAKAEAAEVLREFIKYEKSIIKEMQTEHSYITNGMDIVLNALIATLQVNCIFDEVIKDD